MSAVSAQIIRRIVEVSRGPGSPASLLASVGVSRDNGDVTAAGEIVAAEPYYDLLERCFGEGDYGLPFRYARAVCPEDFRALGLAFKTARDLGDALDRLIRYIVVVSDTLEYALTGGDDGRRLVLCGRPFEQRRGVQLANEAALAAVLSLLRQVATTPVTPIRVSFRHPRPVDAAPHETFFDCPVRFDAREDALYLGHATLSTPTQLGDEGLSAYLLAQLDDLRARRSAGALVLRVRRAVADTLCDGTPRKRDIARRLGMSERTLHRRLAEHGQRFQDVANQVRREVAESLLCTTQHSLSEVAYLTGFSEQSAFHRAFKSWTGQTPRAHRALASS